jgi:hypothetical protein
MCRRVADSSRHLRGWPSACWFISVCPFGLPPMEPYQSIWFCSASTKLYVLSRIRFKYLDTSRPNAIRVTSKTNGSGSAPDPSIFVIDLLDANLTLFFSKSFSAYYFSNVHLYHFSKIKSHEEEEQYRRYQGSSYYFCLMIEGSGSRKPKNIRIIRIQILNPARIYNFLS